MTPAPKMPPIRTESDAERAIANLNMIMDRLTEAVEEETAHLRAGRVAAAMAKDDAKVELARSYAAETDRVKAAKVLMTNCLPEALEALRQRHAAFRKLLQTNLTVLATAHAVSEGIIRGVSGELARRRGPSTYGATGRPNGPGPKAGQPLAICRSL